MATQRFNGLDFEGTLDGINLEPNRQDDWIKQGTFPESSKFRYGVTRWTPDNIWFGAPEISFAGKVTVRGSFDKRDWQIGILQSISKATWAWHYPNGRRKCYRLNTDYRRLKDNRDDESIFLRNPRELSTVCVGWHEAQVNAFDAPSVTFPFRHDSPEIAFEQLIRTEGAYHFHTFLAAVNRNAMTIITFAQCDWTATFDGGYDLQTNEWKPTNPEIMDYRISDEGVLYTDISRSTRLPFSLYLDTALTAMEFQTTAGWVTCCQKGLPISDKGYTPSSRWWGD